MRAVLERLLRLLGRKELLTVFVMIFVADMVVGIFASTFSLYASGLGASLTFIGILSSIVGLTRILASIPIGMISDARGRKGVLLAGMVVLSLSSYLYSVATSPYLLLPIRVLTGLVISSTFFIGMAYVGDMVEKRDRGLVSGVYTTCMGLGFTLGSWLGGQLAETIGYVFTYQIAAIAALLGTVVAWWGLAGRARLRKATGDPVSPLSKLGLLTRRQDLLAASLGYLLIILMFDAAIVNFFPLYATTLLIGQAAIGSMLAFRALISTSVRLPTGILTTRWPSHRLMIVGLILGLVMIVSIAFLTDPVSLSLVLAGEGICFGIYLVSAQTFIVERFGESDRGTAMGVYGMTGSIGSLIGPLVLGVVADFWGLATVFLVTGILVFLGIVAFVYMLRQTLSSDSLQTGSETAATHTG